MKLVPRFELTEVLKKRRIQFGLSQRQIAEELGINQATFSSREVNGFPGGTIGQWEEWAAVLEMTFTVSLSASELHPLPDLFSGRRRE